MRGRIWTCSKEELLETLRKSKSMREALRHFGYCGSGGSATNFKKRLAKEGIDPTVILIPNQPKIRAAADLDKIFVKDSPFCRSTAKRRIILNNLIPYKCAECGLLPVWQDKPLTLILDHQNGDNRDHRLENLRFLCGNCELQSKTHGGRNIRHKKKLCPCGSEISRGAKLCTKCTIKKRILKREGWPLSKKELARLVWEVPTIQLAKHFGVSDRAITKWCRKYEISKPGQGYWMKNPVVALA